MINKIKANIHLFRFRMKRNDNGFVWQFRRFESADFHSSCNLNLKIFNQKKCQSIVFSIFQKNSRNSQLECHILAFIIFICSINSTLQPCGFLGRCLFESTKIVEKKLCENAAEFATKFVSNEKSICTIHSLLAITIPLGC